MVPVVVRRRVTADGGQGNQSNRQDENPFPVHWRNLAGEHHGAFVDRVADVALVTECCSVAEIGLRSGLPNSKKSILAMIIWLVLTPSVTIARPSHLCSVVSRIEAKATQFPPPPHPST